MGSSSEDRHTPSGDDAPAGGDPPVPPSADDPTVAPGADDPPLVATDDNPPVPTGPDGPPIPPTDDNPPAPPTAGDPPAADNGPDAPNGVDEQVAPPSPVEQVLTNAGIAIQALAGQASASDQPFGWRLELDAPRWALNSHKDRGYVPALVLAGGTLLLGGALVALLLILESNTFSRATVTALAVGVGASALALALVSWRAIASWRSMSVLHMDIRRTSPAHVDITYDGGSAPGGDPSRSSSSTRTVRSARPPEGGGGEDTDVASDSPPAGPLGVVAKEPVLVSSTLLGGGTLALGLTSGVDGSTLAAIAAAAIAAGGLLLRQLVTALADPKDQQNRRLTPE